MVPARRRVGRVTDLWSQPVVELVELRTNGFKGLGFGPRARLSSSST